MTSRCSAPIAIGCGSGVTGSQRFSKGGASYTRTRPPSCRPANRRSYWGFDLAPGRRRLPEENVRRFRKRLRGLRDRWRCRTVMRDEVTRRVESWIAHARHADTWRLRSAIFAGGWFEPAAEPDQPPVRPRRAWRVLEQQSTESPLRQFATATSPRIGTTISAFGSRVRFCAGALGFTDPGGVRVSVQGWS